MKRLVPHLLTLVGILAAPAVFGASPEILNVGTEEYVGANGRLPHIAADTQNQPHIVVDMAGSSVNYFYNKNRGSWGGTSYNSGGSQSFNPHIEINDNDQAWVSVVKWYPQGMGMFLIDNMSTTPVIRKYSGTTGGTGGLPVSNLSLDPTINNKAVVYGGNGGWFEKVLWTGTTFGPDGIPPNHIGTLDTGSGGEKNFFHVSRAGNFQHGSGGGGLFGNQAVWHSCSDWEYNNSVRKSNNKLPIHWANYDVYNGMGDDGAYPCIVGDSVEPQTAYMALDLTQFSGQGLVMNIWKGTSATGDGSLVFSKNALLVVDANGTSGLRRYEPQLCPDANGGVWVCYTVGGNIRVRHVPSDTTSTADLGPITEFPGARGAICADKDGNLHVAYSNSGIRYRKLDVAGGVCDFTMPIDADGDGAHDLGIYDAATGNWWVKQATRDGRGTIVTAGRNWGGWSTVVPVPGNYHGTDTSAYEIAVFDTWDGNWFHNPPNVVPHNWGSAGMFPVPADYDGDKMTDLGVYDPTSGEWWLTSISNGVILDTANVWGFDGATPVPADYDGDGSCDLGVYDENTFLWQLRKVDGTIIAENFWWGFQGTIPVPLNYDDDPEFELGAYDPNTGNWYISDVNESNKWFGVNWGFPGVSPAPANYDGDASNIWELGVYNPNSGNWYIRGVNNTTPANWGWPDASAVPLGAH